MIRLLFPFVLLLTGAHCSAMGPWPIEGVAEDGRWYVRLLPRKESAVFALVQIPDSAPPRRPLDGRQRQVPPDWRPTPDEFGVVVARGTCHNPDRLICLRGGQGFVLCGTYQNLAGDPAFVRFDGAGKEVWRLGLGDLFTADEIRSFEVGTRGTVFWDLDMWVDDDRIVVISAGSAGPKVREIQLSDGSHSEGQARSLADRIEDPDATGQEDFAAAWAALDFPSEQTVPAARRSWRRSRTPMAQAAVAVLLARDGDPEARALIAAWLDTPPCYPHLGFYHLPYRHDRERLEYNAYRACAFVLCQLGLAYGETEAMERLQEFSQKAEYLGCVLYGLSTLGDAGLDAAVKLSVIDDVVYAIDYMPYSWLRSWNFHEWCIGEDSVVLARLEAAFRRLGPRERASIAWAWGWFDGYEERTVPLLRGALYDPDAVVRSAAILALNRVQPQTARNQLPLLAEATGAEGALGALARTTLRQTGEELRAEGTPAWWVLLFVWERAIWWGLGALLVWFVLAALFPWRRPQGRTKALAVLGVLTLPPMAASFWAIHYGTSRPWAEPFVHEGFDFMLLKLPQAAMLSVGSVCVLVGLGVLLRKPLRSPARAQASPGG